MDEGVPVTRVSGEIEADLVCGLLRSAGIECSHRVTQAIDSAFDNFAGAGPQEVIVHESDLEAARAVLAEAQSAADDVPD